jgi:hypothetical protein
MGFTLREEDRLRVFQNKVLKRTLGFKRRQGEFGANYVVRSFSISLSLNIIETASVV